MGSIGSQGSDSKCKPIKAVNPLLERVPWGRNVEDLPGTMAAFAAARDSQETSFKEDQRLRSFIKVVSSTSAKGLCMAFPAEFSRKFMPAGTETVTLIDQRGRSWGMSWSRRPGLKWKSFCLHHGLVRGDVCLLVLTDPKRMVFRVNIFKRKLCQKSMIHHHHQGESSRKSESPLHPDRVQIVVDSEDKNTSTEKGDHQMGSEEGTIEEEGMEMMEDEAEIKLSVEPSHSMNSTEQMSVTLVIRKEKCDMVQKMLLGSSAATIQSSNRVGAVNASVRKEMLRSVLELALPLDNEVPY